jgi:hypothetical protein
VAGCPGNAGPDPGHGSAWTGAGRRGFGRLKNEWAMFPLHVRRIYRIRLHVDLTIPAQLAPALLKTRT